MLFKVQSCISFFSIKRLAQGTPFHPPTGQDWTLVERRGKEQRTAQELRLRAKPRSELGASTRRDG